MYLQCVWLCYLFMLFGYVAMLHCSECAVAVEMEFGYVLFREVLLLKDSVWICVLP